MVRFRFAALCGAFILASLGGAFAAEHVVTMKGAAYSPETVTAAVSDTVRFVNDDDLLGRRFRFLGYPSHLHSLTGYDEPCVDAPDNASWFYALLSM
ncbi:MAG: hypothetical protein OER43_19925 [Gammaproteobacteria bacterium]|nr:hypothetical protein [Gammaproteobacteria bacterium]